MKLKIGIFIALVILGVLAYGIYWIHSNTSNQILEFDEVMNYQMDLNPKTKIPERISGFCKISSFCVHDIKCVTKGQALVVLISIGFCNEGQTGNFSYPIKIDENIKELRFGKKEYLLWKRS